MIVDINTSIGHWPFSDLPVVSASGLVDSLQKHGIDKAFVSHLGAVFNLDPTESNRVLIADTSRHEILHPVLTINPAMPGWRSSLDELHGDSPSRFIKIYPQYHNYSLRDDLVAEFVSYVVSHDAKLLVNMRLEDERTRYFGLNVTGVPVDDVIAFHERYPGLQFVCLNAYLPEIRRIASETTGVGVDTSFADWFQVMEELLTIISTDRIHFGSHSPFLYTGASLDKVVQGRINPDIKTRILSTNTIESMGLAVD